MSFIKKTESINTSSSLKIFHSILVLSVMFFLNNCSEETQSELSDSKSYVLVWSDEFDNDQLDFNTWKFWDGTAYNNELQYYTDRDENTFIEDGKLHLQAHRENFNGAEYTSARISTDSTSIGWEKGRFEASIKMPEGTGFWPAFWLMPINDKGWPRSGEIDIMEFRGNEPFTTTGAVHFWRAGCEGNSVECRQYITDHYSSEVNLSDDFHLYALEWTDTELIWFLDDVEFQRIQFDDIEANYSPFTGPFYIILNLAIGGDFLPNPDESTEFPQSLIVDYVRVYQLQ